MTGGATENAVLWMDKFTGVITFSRENLSGLIKVLEGEESAILERLEGSKTLIRLRPGEWEVPGVRGGERARRGRSRGLGLVKY
jgi:NADH:ubiquinone oxidoreductase subunit F (NADH-binding)